jgi:NAD(P)-dependent dehydrogenase (short-subunit alcohol dehydrogenase family)
MRLERKTAIVTGAAAGIGEAAARAFAREGARLVLADLDAARLEQLTAELEETGAIVTDIPGDISLASTCNKLVERATSRYGRLDVLFNCAGIVEGGSLVECTEDQWQRTLDVNLKSMFLMAKAAVPVMLRQGGGSIINMSSVAGPTGVRNRGVYSVSKAAVVGLTKSLAIDFVAEGIRVNCICPATVDTPSLRQRIAQSPDPGQALKDFLSRQPMGRLGTADEIAALAVFLASDESRYMTGQSIFADGGMKL